MRSAKSPAPARSTTRDRLIAAAFAVVARDGLDGASVKQIAAEAGVTPGLLHYHFPTRDALLEAALRRSLDQYLEESRKRREQTPPDRQIEALFDAARAATNGSSAFFRVRLAFAAKALSAPALAEVLRDLNHAAIEETARTLAAARQSVDVSARDRVIAATLKAVFDGLMLSWLNDPAFPLAEAGEILLGVARESLAS